MRKRNQGRVFGILSVFLLFGAIVVMVAGLRTGSIQVLSSSLIVWCVALYLEGISERYEE